MDCMSIKNLCRLLAASVLLISLGCKKEDPIEFPDDPGGATNNTYSGVNITGTSWTSVEGCSVLPQSRLKAIATVDTKLIYTFITANNISGKYNGSVFNLGTQSAWDFGSGSGIEEIVFSNGNPYGLGALGGHGAFTFDVEAYWSWGEVASGGLFTLGTNAYALAEFNGNRVVGCGNNPYVRTESTGNWEQLGEGLDGPVYDLLEFNGDLIAGGSFSNSGSTPVNGVAKWNGTEWLPLGEGLDGGAYELVEFENQLIAIGNFSQSGSGNTACRYVAAWNGTTWEDLDGGLIGGNNGARKVLVYYDQLFIAGDFESAGGLASSNIVKWTSTGWEALPGINTIIGDITVFQEHLYAVNAFDVTNGNFLLRLD